MSQSRALRATRLLRRALAAWGLAGAETGSGGAADRASGRGRPRARRGEGARASTGGVARTGGDAQRGAEEVSEVGSKAASTHALSIFRLHFLASGHVLQPLSKFPPRSEGRKVFHSEGNIDIFLPPPTGFLGKPLRLSCRDHLSESEENRTLNDVSSHLDSSCFSSSSCPAERCAPAELASPALPHSRRVRISAQAHA